MLACRQTSDGAPVILRNQFLGWRITCPLCALLAGMAIVQHAGPEMLRMLSGHMIGENKARFDSAIEEISDCSPQSLGFTVALNLRFSLRESQIKYQTAI